MGVWHQGIRDYWTRQWATIDPCVEPVAFDLDETGHIVVKVHQIVRDLMGRTLSEGWVEHVYLIEDGLIKSIEIRKVGRAGGHLLIICGIIPNFNPYRFEFWGRKEVSQGGTEAS